MTTSPPPGLLADAASDEAKVISPSRPAYLEAVEGLRGIAALLVVIYHCFTSSGEPEWRPLFGINVLRVFDDGWCGVNLFLVLSGFCLFWPFARNENRPLQLWPFAQKRIWRIMPAYYASLLLVPLIYWVPTWLGLPSPLNSIRNFVPFCPTGTGDFALHLLLLQSFSAKAFNSWNPVAWSLGLEWVWYAFFPLAVWMFRKWGPYWTMLLCVGISAGYCASIYRLVGPTSSLELNVAFTLRSFLFGRLFEFAAGMLVAWWLANRAITPCLTRLAVLGVVPFLVFAHITASIDPVWPVRNALYCTAFSLMLFATVSTTTNPIKRLCSSQHLQTLGRWSYSLYLFHLPLIIIMTNVLALGSLKGPARFFVSLLVVPVTIVVARWGYLMFEQPFLTSKPPIAASV